MTKIELTFGTELGLDGKPLYAESRERALALIRACALEHFGGFTLSFGDGSWLDPETGRIFSEKNATLSLLFKKEEGWKFRVRGVAKCIKTELRQKCIAVVQSEVKFSLI